jgi:hypothetical protein
MPDKGSRDVKVLHLSATPINNKLVDIRNQFKLMTKGIDNGFEKTELEINSLESIFRTAQKDFNDWGALDTRKISDFISKLPQNFFDLTDALIVARTRKLIEGEFGSMNFPKKDGPVNEYITPENFGDLKSFDDILNALRVNLTAYRPSEYIKDLKIESVLENPKQREKFLVKMMYILLMKRMKQGKTFGTENNTQRLKLMYMKDWRFLSGLQRLNKKIKTPDTQANDNAGHTRYNPPNNLV